MLLEQAFEARHPDIDVRWLDMGRQEILDRLRFERVNPQADVWFGGPTTIFDRGIRDSLLAPYRPAWAGTVGAGGVGPGRSLLSGLPHARGDRLQQPGGVAARGAAATGTRCSSPRWQRQGADPRSDGERHHARDLGTDPRAQHPRRPATPRRAWRGFAGSTARPRPTPSTRRSSTSGWPGGEGLVTLWDLPDILISRAKGMPFDYVFPRSGTVVIDDAIGLVRGSRHPEAARGVHRLRRQRGGAAARRARRCSGCRRGTTCRPTRCPTGSRRSSARWSWPTMDWALLAREGAGLDELLGPARARHRAQRRSR